MGGVWKTPGSTWGCVEDPNLWGLEDYGGVWRTSRSTWGAWRIQIYGVWRTLGLWWCLEDSRVHVRTCRGPKSMRFVGVFRVLQICGGVWRTPHLHQGSHHSPTVLPHPLAVLGLPHPTQTHLLPGADTNTLHCSKPLCNTFHHFLFYFGKKRGGGEGGGAAPTALVVGFILHLRPHSSTTQRHSYQTAAKGSTGERGGPTH